MAKFKLQTVMKKLLFILIVLVNISVSALAINKIPSDTNKVNAEGKKEGFWKEKLEHNDYFGNYINDKKEGIWIGYYTSEFDKGEGSITIYHYEYNISNMDEYKNGKRNGMSIVMDPKGYIYKRESYVNDTLDGLSIVYFPGSKLRTKTEYKMGMLNGLNCTYYSDGRIKEEISYKNNVRDGASRWFYPKDDYSLRNGKISVEYMYKNGVLEGTQKTFYKNGVLESAVNAINNLEEGDFYSYHENSEKKVIGKYVHGLKQGVWTEFDILGKVIKTETYKDGELAK